MYRNCIITIVIINIIVYIVVMMMCLNSQVVVTYLGFCWDSEVTPKVLIVGDLATSWGKISAGGM